MAWKSREDKLPPPSYFTLIVAHLQAAYQGARISRQMMETLRPFFIEAWRNGRTAAAAAQTTCSCNGREIVPSPVVGVHIAKGSVRPPKGAQRGEVFGAEDLRQPPKIERLQHTLTRITREDQKQQVVETRWGDRAQRAPSEVARANAARKQTAAATKRADLLREAQRIEAEIRRLRNELHRSPPRGSAPKSPPAAVPQPIATVLPAAAPPVTAPPVQVPAQPTEAAKARPGRPPKRKAATTATETTSANSPATDAQSVALLGAVQGLLPGLAKQLADQIVKDEGGKT